MKKVVAIVFCLLIIIIAVSVLLSKKGSVAGSKNINLFIELGFTQEQSTESSKIISKCNLKNINGKIIELNEYEHSDITEDMYDEAYTCMIYDNDVDEYRHINLYYKNRELIYICSSNHMIQYYSKEKGIIKDSHRSFVN